MCGIAVHVALESSEQDRKNVEESLTQVHHRGPDGSNVLVVPEDVLAGASVVLGHTRLAIVGNDNATQPLKWTVGNLHFYLVHNGEIYEYKCLREKLISEGDCKRDDFKTNGDSEVLLACLALRGIHWTLDNIRGMFAFVFVECHVTEEGQRLNKIVACRDPFGIKPLCYGFNGTREKLFLCSEAQAMPRDIGIGDLQDVLPSSFIEVSFQLGNSKRSWSICEHKYGVGAVKSLGTPNSSLPEEQLSAIRSKLLNAISIRIPEKARFAVLLSGGLDSSLICRLAADFIHPEPLYTFTISTSNDRLDSDSHYARLVAEATPNIIHKEVEFSFQDCLQDIVHVVQCIETNDLTMIRAGIPLYHLSKHISAQGFKVVLCGEGADEALAGYRLFEEYLVNESDSFSQELNRRLFNIDTSELQRVDRCTSAHGLEARVPFMDVAYVNAVMGISVEEKMTHPALGRIQKYLLRTAFEQYQSKVTGKQLLPDSVLYREKEQFADGVGRSWLTDLQEYAQNLFPDLTSVDAERALYNSYLNRQPGQLELKRLIQCRKDRRRSTQLVPHGTIGKSGCSQPTRWYPVQNDPDLKELHISKDDAIYFLKRVLGWSHEDAHGFSPSLESLNRVIVSMLERVPFHNLTLLTRERRPPTMAEIREDMMSGIGGPCSVVNSFFAVVLDRLGFGPHVYLLSCEINHRSDCHVAILLQFKGLRYFVDVANAKPYTQAVYLGLGGSSQFTGLDGSFCWGLTYNEESSLMEVHHSKEKAISFHPASTVPYKSFRAMITRSRSDTSFGPFLTGLRFVVFPENASRILAVRDACIYDGSSTQLKYSAASKQEILSIARRPPFSLIQGFEELVDAATAILDRENPGWFERSQENLRERVR
ncbi:hypothetical protein ACHAXR_012513 [Thalassiosira sp. AJA248-18]